MDLHLVCQRRNFELEDIKHAVKAKRQPVRVNEDPLSIFKREAQRERVAMDIDDQEQIGSGGADDSVAATITHKLGQSDPLADFHKLEVLMLNRNEFETWD